MGRQDSLHAPVPPYDYPCCPRFAPDRLSRRALIAPFLVAEFEIPPLYHGTSRPRHSLLASAIGAGALGREILVPPMVVSPHDRDSNRRRTFMVGEAGNAESELVEPLPSSAMNLPPVRPLVNKPQNQGPELIKPAL